MQESIQPAAKWRLPIFVALVLLIPALVGQGNLTKRKFDPSPREKFMLRQPEVVLIGDSMLDTRIDNDFLKKISGIKFQKMVWPGSGSATWYLVLKNYLAPLTKPPRAVIFFFRDRQLTLADYHTEGRYRPRLEALTAAEGDPFLTATLRAAQSEQAGFLQTSAQILFPLQKHQLEWQEKVYTRALILSSPSPERSRIKDESNRLFSARHLRADDGAHAEDSENMGGLNPADHDFATMLPRSFLPAILELAAQKKIRLVFYQVRRRPAENGRTLPEDVDLRDYRRGLEKYLRENGALFIDETGDAEVVREFYGGDDHVREDRMSDYTALFWRKHGAEITEAIRGSADGP